MPVVGAGVVAGALAAVASARPWFTGAGLTASQALPEDAGVGEMPLAAALSLVVLAGWGVVLVTRRRVRRAAAGLTLLASLGLVVTVVVGWSTVPHQVSAAVVDTVGSDAVSVSSTAWFWVAAVAAPVLVAASVAALAWSPVWPEMGSRYDAPGSGPEEPAGDVPPEERSNLDLWKSLDEGRDPTA